MRAIVGAVLCAAALVAGCSDTVSGEATKEPIQESAFVPCDDIPDEVISSLGLDPSTEVRDTFGVKYPGWNRCAWHDGPVTVAVSAARRPLDAVRSNAAYASFEDVEINGRRAVSFLSSSLSRDAACHAAMESVDGFFLVAVMTTPSVRSVDTCAQALTVARAVQPFTTS